MAFLPDFLKKPRRRRNKLTGFAAKKAPKGPF
jgi:hypothetical protein